jgi:hypothetical protein
MPNKVDCHCEERSDEAIRCSVIEIASLALAMTRN